MSSCNRPKVVDTSWYALDNHVVTTITMSTLFDDEGNVVEVGIESTPCLVVVKGNVLDVMDFEEFRERYGKRNDEDTDDGVG